MNKEKFIALLVAALHGISVHQDLILELLGILKSSGSEQAFLDILIARLKFLDERGIHAVRHQEFELLDQGIYSMHLARKEFNIRILYCFLSDGRPALLCAFFERAGHKDTDYTHEIPKAVQRRKELEEELS
ncbi:hypothetical protein D7X94_11825 [Acutalibacter sp. 1XD8-33]|uniref:type II toxin-antitoxin system RelE/ParE family toxin n=1 Tax=Acutalibacter sp. 1XD8-33 TaxID=2320081 RepID=UPI000EA11157|nr:type II toxin-antitoxin system RelE/ParE family toxin [Acutalibacter sp. 1XD8-33]RKJ39526.1 hypothetical protein D7X94_11825 [Acutalibacter sp. 1XD8-33]